jgi:hypothetical protein
MIDGYLNQTTLNKMDHNTDKSYCLAITSNKKLYNENDSITVNIKNIVDNTLVFPDSSLGMKIENIKTNESFEPLAATVITMLNPNETRTFKVLDLNNTKLNSKLEQGIYKINFTLLTDQIPMNCSIKPLNIEIVK